MKSFLCKGKKPIIKWGMLPHGIFYKGDVPKGYSLAICPSPGYIVIDVDRHKDKNGFDYIRKSSLKIQAELLNTLNYPTKNNGQHFWFKYTGNIVLGNKASNVGIDLRTDKGYVIWYPESDIRDKLDEIKETSNEMNKWLKELFIPKNLKYNKNLKN